MDLKQINSFFSSFMFALLIGLVISLLVDFFITVTLYMYIGIVLLSSLVLYLKRYKNSLVLRLSENPQALFILNYRQLKEAQKRLTSINRWETILALANTTNELVEKAISFYEKPTAQTLVEHLDIVGYEKAGEFYHLKGLDLGLPRMDSLFLSLTNKSEEMLDNRYLGSERILLISLEEHQDGIAKLAQKKSNNLIAPTNVELIELLLSKNPKSLLVKLFLNCLSFKYLSSYQMKQGVRHQENFFGRTEIIKKMTSNEKSNYLLVGARQLGKSSIVEELRRYYAKSANSECHYYTKKSNVVCHNLSLEYEDVIRAINIVMDIEKLVTFYITNEKRHMVFLIDDADIIVNYKESERIISTLRKFSEEGSCSFVLVGSWSLYESALKNFGEVIELKELEEEACRDLMVKPMQRIGVEYENETMVNEVVERCGRRANLIATVCDQVLTSLEGRVICQEDIERSIDKQTVRNLLSDWEFQSVGSQNSVNQLVVYLTYDKETFTLSDIVDLIKEQNLNVPIKQVEKSLKIFVLAYIFKRTKSVYSYQVPLLKEYLLEDPNDMENRLFGVVDLLREG